MFEGRGTLSVCGTMRSEHSIVSMPQQHQQQPPPPRPSKGLIEAILQMDVMRRTRLAERCHAWRLKPCVHPFEPAVSTLSRPHAGIVVLTSNEFEITNPGETINRCQPQEPNSTVVAR